MNKLILYTLFTFLVCSCEPREVDTIDVRKVWQAGTVKENGKMVYNRTDTLGSKTGYARFRLNLRQINTVSFTDFDGRDRTGNWSLANQYQTLLLSNMTTSAKDTTTRVKFDILNQGGSTLKLKRTIEGAKSALILREYELIPE